MKKKTPKRKSPATKARSKKVKPGDLVRIGFSLCLIYKEDGELRNLILTNHGDVLPGGLRGKDLAAVEDGGAVIDNYCSLSQLLQMVDSERATAA